MRQEGTGQCFRPSMRFISLTIFSREWVMDLFAAYLTKVYNFVVLIPRWLLFILTGAIGSVIINFLHRPSKKQAAGKVPIKREPAPTSGAQTSTSKPGVSTSTPTSSTTVKSEPAEKPTTSTTATSPRVTTRRNGKKGKGKKQQA